MEKKHNHLSIKDQTTDFLLYKTPDGEIKVEEFSTSAKNAHVQKEDDKDVKRAILVAIIAVSYRVNSKRNITIRKRINYA
jgi:hypothetical protein